MGVLSTFMNPRENIATKIVLLWIKGEASCQVKNIQILIFAFNKSH